MRDCDRRFATPTEQRVHEALHRIKNMGIIPNMPSFSAPIATTSAPPPPPPVEEEVTAEAAAEAAKSDGMKSPDFDPTQFMNDGADEGGPIEDLTLSQTAKEEGKEEGAPSGSGEPAEPKPEGSEAAKPADTEDVKPAEVESEAPKPDEPAGEPSSTTQAQDQT
jgi:hypothetical protein